MADCRHTYQWHRDECNERGWKCIDCGDRPGEPAGYSPELDRTLTRGKVESLLLDLHNFDFMYVSNACGGEALCSVVAKWCHDTGRYDQRSILWRLLQDEGHAEYWREVGEGVMKGEDKRNRCECGALATVWKSVDNLHQCTDCSRKEWANG